MVEYHVATSDITGCIYAGRAKQHGNLTEWIDKLEVTEEAVRAVAAHMLLKVEENPDSTYTFKLLDGRWAKLKLEIYDHKEIQN